MLVLPLMLLIIQPSSAFSHQPALPLSNLHKPLHRGTNNLHYHILSNRQDAFLNINTSSQSSADLALHMKIPRGGALASLNLNSPESVYNSIFSALGVVAVLFKLLQQRKGSSSASDEENAVSEKPAAVKSLQKRFLLVFWLLRCADWLQGPYFYDVYKSKVFNGVPATIGIISKIFLAGFASTAIFGPYVGRFADSNGRKKGTLAFCALYTLGALSTKSALLTVLLLGRLVNGIGTSLLFSAPESWLVGEAMSIKDGGKYLGETFGLVSLSVLHTITLK